MLARWVTLKDHPWDARTFDPKTGKTDVAVKYDQDGAVWQAEEVFKDGRRRRFYGFVGRYDVARVPAEDIEFPADELARYWANLSGGLDCRVLEPGASEQEGLLHFVRLGVGGPLWFTIKLRNRTGLDRDVPALYYQPATPDGAPPAPGPEGR